MSKEIKVSAINIKIGDVEVSVTPKQARELRAALDEVLGKDRVERVIEREPYPYIWPRVWYATTTTNADDWRYIYAGDSSGTPPQLAANIAIQ